MPLPPIAEQVRIVKKVDELMTICDRLEAELEAARADSGRFLESFLDKFVGLVRVSSNIAATAQAKKNVTVPRIGRESRFMTENPVMTVDQLVECIDGLDGPITPEQLLMKTGQTEDIEAFYDLLRAARDSGKVAIHLGSGENIRRRNDED